jgi:hypothetical protein
LDVDSGGGGGNHRAVCGSGGDGRRRVVWIVVDEAALHVALTSGGAKLPPPIASGASSDFLEPSKFILHPRNPCENTQNYPLQARDIANMKLNVKNIRYLSPDDWRVLTAVCARTVFPSHSGELTADEDHDRQRWAAATMKSYPRP